MNDVKVLLYKDLALWNVAELAFTDYFRKMEWNTRKWSKSGQGGNKLRTYRLFKYEFYTELYALCIMDKQQRNFDVELLQSC